MGRTRDHTSRRLSWLLRHGAGEVGLAMDEAGWVALVAVERELGFGRDAIERVVQENEKRRFQIDAGRIRATQGHSLDGMPVTVEGLEASWSRFDGDDRVFHGTNVEAARSIAESGIAPGARSHVHLAPTVTSRVGKRARVAVLLEVSVARLRAEGHEVFVSPNGVVLTRFVPSSCVVALDARTPQGEQHVDELRAVFGVDAPH